jgi:HSP20 family protein
MMEDMDRIFSNFGFGVPLIPQALLGQDQWGTGASGGIAPSASLQTVWSPQCEVIHRGDSLVVRADLPGLKKEDVDIEVEDGVLTIRGERRQESEDERGGVYRSERSYGSFYRAIALPETANAENAQASFNDGVLEVTIPLPKTEQRSRKIQVR